VSEAQVKVVGFDELVSGSLDLAERVVKSATDEFGHVAESRAAAARARVPHVTGRMAAAIVGQVVNERAHVGIPDRTQVPYAGWVEFGGTRGRPYYPQGRYIFPVGLSADAQLVVTGSAVARREIGETRWKTPHA